MNTLYRRAGRARRWGRRAAVCCLSAACLWIGVAQARADTGNVRGYFETGRALVEAGKPAPGLVYVAVAVALSPTNLAAQTYLLAVLDRGCCRAELGLHEALHAVLPNYRPLTERLAVLQRQHARFEEAGQRHLQAAGLDPDDPAAQERLATYYAFVGRNDLAQAADARAQALGDREVPPAPAAAEPGVFTDSWNRISLEPDAEAGDPFSMFVAGRKYIVNGSNAGRQDWLARGIGYLERSARAGFTGARRFLGALYLAGELVPQDIPRGMAHYERAAAAGDVIAQRQLADMYFAGDPVARNLSRAVFWYQTILHNPNRGLTAYKSEDTWQIEVRLADLYLDGEGVERDPARARELLEHAARSSKAPPALEALADLFRTGFAGDERDQHALMMYAAAARGYLDHGYQYGFDPDASRREAGAILRTMERISPDARLTRQLRTRLTVLSSLSAAP